MKSLYCDVCKKEVENPVTGVTYFHITTHDLCESCKNALDDKLKPVLRQHAPYTESWYQQIMDDLIIAGIEKNRI